MDEFNENEIVENLDYFTHEILFKYKSELLCGHSSSHYGSHYGLSSSHYGLSSSHYGLSSSHYGHSSSHYGSVLGQQQQPLPLPLGVPTAVELLPIVEDGDHLIPIKLEIDLENDLKLRDSFTWNLNEYLISPEKFAEIMVSEWDLNAYNIQISPLNPLLQPGALVSSIADSIKQQVAAFVMAVEQEAEMGSRTDTLNHAKNTGHDIVIDILDHRNGYSKYIEIYNDQLQQDQPQTNLMDLVSVTKNEYDAHVLKDQIKGKEEDNNNAELAQLKQEIGHDPTVSEQLVMKTISEMRKEQSAGRKDEPIEPSYGDIRIIIKIDVHVGALYLRDQFEWPLFEMGISPEEFSRQLCADVGLGGEFVNLVATSIREQIVLARLNFDDAYQAPLYSRYLRDIDDSGWEPDVRFLNNAAVAALAKEDERNSRRMRRQRQNIGAAQMPVNRGDGRRKGDVPLTKASLSTTELLDLNRLVSISFADPTTHTIPPVTDVLASQPRPPIYIDTCPPPHLQIDPVVAAQQLAMIHASTTAASNRGKAEWRCTWCLVQQIYTPTIRRGPAGARTVCQMCGIWYVRAGVLPRERYHACKEGPV